MKLKKELFRQCQDFVNKQHLTIEETISSNQKALQSETKSSAGDKHETGRAMLQLEMEKAGQQLSAVKKMKEILAKTDVSKTAQIAHLGSVIITNTANYFLSISAGQLKVNSKIYFAISVSSPIGSLLLGKQKGEDFYFNKKKINIIEVK